MKASCVSIWTMHIELQGGHHNEVPDGAPVQGMGEGTVHGM